MTNDIDLFTACDRNGDDGKRHDDENLVVEKKFPTTASTLTKELWVKLNKKLRFNKVLEIAGNDKLVNDLSKSEKPDSDRQYNSDNCLPNNPYKKPTTCG